MLSQICQDVFSLFGPLSVYLKNKINAAKRNLPSKEPVLIDTNTHKSHPFELGFGLGEFKSHQKPNQDTRPRPSWTVANVSSQDTGYSWAIQKLVKPILKDHQKYGEQLTRSTKHLLWYWFIHGRKEVRPDFLAYYSQFKPNACLWAEAWQSLQRGADSVSPWQSWFCDCPEETVL